MFYNIEELKDVIKDEEGIVTFDGLDDCIVGLAQQHTKPVLVVYDRNLIVEHCIKEGMTDEEADEYVSFNIDCLWVGEKTPLIMCPLLSPR